MSVDLLKKIRSLNPAADLQALRAFAQANDCSLFMVLLTAYYSLLWRYTGQEDIVVGTPVALRRQADIETMVGVFINTLPLRVDPKPGSCSAAHSSNKRKGFSSRQDKTKANRFFWPVESSDALMVPSGSI